MKRQGLGEAGNIHTHDGDAGADYGGSALDASWFTSPDGRTVLHDVGIGSTGGSHVFGSDAVGVLDPAVLVTSGGASTSIAPSSGDGGGVKSWISSPAYQVVSLASAAASAYHGYKRNNSVGWALWWGFAGSLLPVIVPVIAVAQGFGKPSRRSNPSRRRRGRR